MSERTISRPHFVAKLSGASRGTIELNGEPLGGVQSFEIKGGVGKACHVTIELIGVTVEVDDDTPIVEVRTTEVTAIDSESRQYVLSRLQDAA